MSIALFQKSILDMIAGFWLATAGFNIYGVFDFITFSETLSNYDNLDINIKKFDFVLQ